MDTVTSLLGNKIFKSLYDPAADKLAAEFRSKVGINLGSLQGTLAKAKDVQSVLKDIPGVSDSTKNSIDSLLRQAEDFTKGASNLTPNQIAAKRDELATKLKELTTDAKAEVKEKKVEEKKKKAEALKEQKENQTFSLSRMAKRMFENGKFYLLVFGLVFLALWGGSISSNANFSRPWYFRLYYFIYGALLFPVSFVFALIRYSTGTSGPYYAILAPLIEGPLQNPLAAFFLAPFVYGNPNAVPVLPVVPIANPQIVPEAQVLANAARTAQGLTGTGV